MKHAGNVMWIGVVALAGMGLGLAGGCAEDSSAATSPSKEKLPVTVVNATGGPLTGVGMKAGNWNVSWGDVNTGASETISLPEGARPATMYVTWRDPKGDRHFQNLALPSAGVRSTTITIRGDQAAATFR